jgi:outer membrane protein insertion porin family
MQKKIIGSWLQRAAFAAALCTAAPPGPGAVLHAQQGVAGPGSAPRLSVDSLTVRGNERQTPESIIGVAGILRGDTIDYRKIQEAIRRIWSTGSYSDVKVYADGPPGEPHATLVIEVKEQPFLAEIQMHGLENVNGNSLADSVGLRTGSYFSPGKVARLRDLVRSGLAKKGFQLRDFEHKLEPMPLQPGEFRLVVTANEGQRVALTDIEFEGNSVFTDEELRGSIETKEEGFLWFREGHIDELKLATDLRTALPDFYGAKGYIDFAVLGDSIAIDPETGKARLVVRLDEGAQYRLASFEVTGNHRFPTDELRRYFEQQEGGLLQGLGIGGGPDTVNAFDRSAFERATERVGQAYRNQGYLYARVEPVIERDTMNGGRVVNVSWAIQEGQPAYVNRVSVSGNTFTHERVIREQVLLLPGDVYNEELLIQSYRNISALNFFDQMPMPRIEPNEKGDVDILFEVKEKQTGSVNFGTALGGGAGVAGFLGYDQPNLFGQAKSGHLRWEFGRYSNNFEAGYTDPGIKGSLISGSLNLFSARDRFFRFNEGQQRRTGASVRFGLPLPSDRSGRSRLFVGYSLSRTTYEQFEEGLGTSVFGLPPGIQSTVTLSMVRNTLDNPMFPTVGTKQEFSVDLNGGPLQGDANFQKYSVNGAWFVPIGALGSGPAATRPLRFTLGLNADAGSLFGDAARFPFQRYSLGGVQYGRPLRGYEETTLTPGGYVPRCTSQQLNCVQLEDRFGNAYFRMSSEVAMRFNNNLSLSLFYDAGNIWRKAVEINPTRLFRGAGVGVMLVTPFGPLGLDYAYGFDKDVPGWQLHFKFGQGF